MTKKTKSKILKLSITAIDIFGKLLEYSFYSIVIILAVTFISSTFVDKVTILPKKEYRNHPSTIITITALTCRQCGSKEISYSELFHSAELIRYEYRCNNCGMTERAIDIGSQIGVTNYNVNSYE